MSYLRATLRFIHIFASTAETDSVVQVSSHLDGFPAKSTIGDKSTQVTDLIPVVINANII